MSLLRLAAIGDLAFEGPHAERPAGADARTIAEGFGVVKRGPRAGGRAAEAA